MKQQKIDIVCVTLTNLRGNINQDGEIYTMISKGRSKMVKKEGGVGVLLNKTCMISCQESDIEDKEFSEDILIVRCNLLCDDFILIICYMTVEGASAHIENKAKYLALSEIINRFKNDRVVVAGDMNGHTGILGEKINSN